MHFLLVKKRIKSQFTRPSVQSFNVEPSVGDDSADDGLVKVRADDVRTDEVDLSTVNGGHRRQDRLSTRVVDNDADVAVSDGQQHRIGNSGNKNDGKYFIGTDEKRFKFR